MIYALRHVANNKYALLTKIINRQSICHKNSQTMSEYLRWQAGCKADKILDYSSKEGKIAFKNGVTKLSLP